MKKKQFSGSLKRKVHKKSNYTCAYCNKKADKIIGELAFELNPSYELSVLLDEIEYRKAEGSRCKSIFDIDIYVSFEVDHIIPEFRGGETKLDNLILACRSCNRSKGIKIDGLA